MVVLLYIWEAVCCAVALSMDAFISGFAYGSGKIKIPLLSVLIIDVACKVLLGLSVLLGVVMSSFVSDAVASGLSCGILVAMGVIKLLDYTTKRIIARYDDISKEIKFSALNFKFVLRLYADPLIGDVDRSMNISAKEAVSVAVALSLDGLGVGFGAALFGINAAALIVAAFVTDGLALIVGHKLGIVLARRARFNISWLSGALLIALGVSKVV